MTKALSKILAVILSVCILFAVPIMANAEENVIELSNGVIVAVEGDWESDYVDSVIVKVDGDVVNFAADTILTVGSGASFSNLKTLSVAGAVYTFSGTGESGGDYHGDDFTVTVPLDIHVNHAETYNFRFPEGTFVNVDGSVNEEYTFSVTGNEFIEAIDVEEVPVTPIQKLIVYLSGLNAEGFWKKLLDFLIAALTWFVNI